MYGDGFFDVPAGYRDADLEMAELEDRGRRAKARYRVFGYPWDTTRVDRLRAGETVETVALTVKDTGETFVALARPVDEDDVGPICEWSIDNGASWHASRKAARAAR